MERTRTELAEGEEGYQESNQEAESTWRNEKEANWLFLKKKMNGKKNVQEVEKNLEFQSPGAMQDGQSCDLRSNNFVCLAVCQLPAMAAAAVLACERDRQLSTYCAVQAEQQPHSTLIGHKKELLIGWRTVPYATD